MASTLFLMGSIFIGINHFVIQRTIVSQYEELLQEKLTEFRKDYHEDLDYSQYLREKEKGLRGFMTLFDMNNTILASTSPELSHAYRVPPGHPRTVKSQMEDPDFDFDIFNFELGFNGVECMGLVGKVGESYYLFLEKSLDTIDDAITVAIQAMLFSLVIVLFPGFILAYFFSYLFIKPILMINKKAKSIAALNFYEDLVIKNNDEIGDLGESINEISAKLMEYVDELQTSNRQLVHDRQKLEILNETLDSISRTDKLTQLANRLQVDKVLQDEVYKAQERNGLFSVILLDIDFFKRVNDDYGHQTGDQVLKEFASILKENSRRLDLVGRWGGEEFILILPDTPLKGAIATAEKIRAAVEGFNFTEVGQKTASMGVGEYCKDHSLDYMIKRIDEALYRAKKEGRNRVIEANFLTFIQRNIN